MFDMRHPSINSEYPILCASSGNLEFAPQSAPSVANSFIEVCQGRTNVERMLNGRRILTEDEWRVWTDPGPMLDECDGRNRKLRLFACACCRNILSLLPDQRFQRAIEVAERYADNQATDQERTRAKKKCKAVANELLSNLAASAATETLSSDAEAAAWNVTWKAASAESNGDRESTAWTSARARQSNLLREIFGNPFRSEIIAPSWLTTAVAAIAQVIYDERRFEDMPILGDALEDAGCNHQGILSHCREILPHVRGCWLLDLLLKKE